jgi:hypothetical protein
MERYPIDVSFGTLVMFKLGGHAISYLPSSNSTVKIENKRTGEERIISFNRLMFFVSQILKYYI